MSTQPKPGNPSPGTLNNALWAAMRNRDTQGMQRALEGGANPDITRQAKTPLQAILDFNDETFLLEAWAILDKAGSDMGAQCAKAWVGNLARKLIAQDDDGLERVWATCVPLRGRLLRECAGFASHKNAGIPEDRWAASLKRVLWLPGAVSHHGAWVACFSGDWHRGGFNPDVVEQLVKFDTDPQREVARADHVRSFCQAIALYDQHGVVVHELCTRHLDWLAREDGWRGHELVEQLIKYNQGYHYGRVHALAPYLVASQTPSASRVMAAAAFGCEPLAVEDPGHDPAAALAKQGFSLAHVFDHLPPNDLHDRIRGWQKNHWKTVGGNSMHELVQQAIERIEGFGFNRFSTWSARHDEHPDPMEEARLPAFNGMGLMHIWCSNNTGHRSFVPHTPLGVLGEFERMEGPGLIEAATIALQDDPAHAVHLLPTTKTLDWALSCGARLDHPGMIEAARRIVFCPLWANRPINDRNMGQWLETVEWLIKHEATVPDPHRLVELDGINSERPWSWRQKIEDIRLALATLNHKKMDDGTPQAHGKSRPAPRL